MVGLPKIRKGEHALKNGVIEHLSRAGGIIPPTWMRSMPWCASGGSSIRGKMSQHSEQELQRKNGMQGI